jgi:c-di-GMP-binding flagellar brake protein YcgR
LIIALGVCFIAVSYKKRDGGNWVEFYSKGKGAGFSFKEIEMLRHLAVQCNIESPLSLFWSQDQLDKCIHSMVRNIKMSGENENRGIQDFLSKLYDYRKKLEIDKNQVKYSITNSRYITEGQTLRVLVAGSGVFKSQVVKNTNQYLTITRPVTTKDLPVPVSMAWTGAKISVYFWREEDAGYVFDSDVVDEVYSLGISSLKITHGESLFRTQKRKSVRVKMHKAAFLYLVSGSEPAHKIEIDPGLKCFLEDISDTGCAVVVGGKADTGLRVKVQFALDNAAVCMTGTVRSAEFKDDANRSILHIEAETLPLETRHHILGEMFGTMPDEDEDELPFRVLDGTTANNNSSDNGSSGGDPPEDSNGTLDGNDAAGENFTQKIDGA